MRFPSTDDSLALIRLADGQPIKVAARDAENLPDGVYEYNDVLFDMLRSAFENEDDDALVRLWAAAHRWSRHDHHSGGGMPNSEVGIRK